MAPAAVYLHIGSPKTGTTFVQDMLWTNRNVLEDDGVLLPGHKRYARVHAVRDVLAWDPSEESEAPKSWLRLAAEVNRWEGRAAILSQEFLCWAAPEQIAAVVGSFPRDRVHVVLTVRDLARLVPAQWQTAMRQRNTWTLDEYADAVAGTSSTKAATAAARHFWKRQDYGPILTRWVEAVGRANVSVVTLPPSGSDPDLLWHRFCQACGLDPQRTEPGEVSHESLGAASAEIMRRLNERPAVSHLPMDLYQKSVNGALSRRVLGPRRSQEPSLVLPEEHREWAEREASRLISDIEAVGVTVHGDLDDLRPRPTTKPGIAPEQLPAEVLLEAALDGLAGLAADHANLVKKLGPEGRKNLGEAIKAVPIPEGVSGVRAAWRRRHPR